MNPTDSGSDIETPPTIPHGEVFERWLAARAGQRRLRQPSSIAVYRSMWEAFCKWLIGRGQHLGQISPSVLADFLDDRAQAGMLSDRHAWRWLSLLDGVLQHAQPGERSLSPNRAALQLLEAHPRWRYANASARDPLPEHLSAAQARQLVRWLLDDSSGYHAAGAKPGSWQALRNRASVALQLGAGLTPGDIRVLQTRHVLGQPAGARGPWRVRIPKHGAVDPHEAPIAPWAARLVSRWLARRTEEALPGDLLFPGTRKGTAWTKVAHYLAAGSVLAAAGLPDTGGGSFILRHTFALRQLRRGHPADEVARWLGVSDPGVMARYEQVQFEDLTPA